MKSFTTMLAAAVALAIVPASIVHAADAKKMTPAHKMAATHKMASHGKKMGMKKGHAKMAAATKYECSKCHMQYSAAEAKKDKYKCDMDGGKLVPVKPGAKKSM